MDDFLIHQILHDLRGRKPDVVCGSDIRIKSVAMIAMPLSHLVSDLLRVCKIEQVSDQWPSSWRRGKVFSSAVLVERCHLQTGCPRILSSPTVI